MNIEEEGYSLNEAEQLWSTHFDANRRLKLPRFREKVCTKAVLYVKDGRFDVDLSQNIDKLAENLWNLLSKKNCEWLVKLWSNTAAESVKEFGGILL